jgi:dihydrofolate reductase / thymidylate synthase
MIPRKLFDIVVATSRTYGKLGIGSNGDLPWRSVKEMNIFKEITTNGLFANENKYCNMVIMGRKTFDSIPDKYRPLKNRVNLVISKSYFDTKPPYMSHEWFDDNNKCGYFNSFDGCLSYINDNNLKGNVYVIGGSQIYDIALRNKYLRYIYMSDVVPTIRNNFEADTFFDMDENNHRKIYESPYVKDNELMFSLGVYKRRPNNNFTDNDSEINPKITNALGQVMKTDDLWVSSSIPVTYSTHPENQYLDLLRDIMVNGAERGDRTGTGVFSVFGRQLRFNDISNQFPLLTTKKVFWKGVVLELLWFLSGNTNANNLKNEGVHIWDGNTSRGFLDKSGLEYYEEGDCGPFYGFQWRHFNAEYKGMDNDYTDKGYDQVQWCINEIRKNPTSRRLIVSAWNASELDKMCLNPCHVMYQFYCDPDKREMSVHMYQRSADVFLGLPFNIASTALFLKLMCYMTNYKAKDVIVSLGDAHIYSNHVNQCNIQLKRKPYEWTQVIIDPRETINKIDMVKFDDIKLVNYQSHGSIKAKMAV